MTGQWKVLGVGLFLSAAAASAATIGYAGDSFDDSNPAFIASLEAGTGHTFRPITRFDAAQLSGLDAVWLDGFSAFFFSDLQLRAAELEQFIRGGGQLLVQSAGFGGDPLSDYPVSSELTAVPTETQMVRLLNPWRNPTTLTSEELSGWTDGALPGYYTIAENNTRWMGIADTGIAGQWVSVGTQHGAGSVIYTFQDMSRMVFEPRSEDAMQLFGMFIVPEPTSAALLVAGGALLLRRRKRA